MSSFRSKMKKGRAGLKNQHNKKSNDGNQFPTIFKKKKIPEGVGFFKCTEGGHKVDIIPWVAGKNMPIDYETGEPITAKGDFAYVLDVWVHTNVGSMKQPYVCPYKNFDKPCPICEYINKARLPKDEWVKVSAKRRAVYLIWDRTDREQEKKGIQIFDAAHFFMEEKLKEIAERPEEGGYIFFSDIGSKKNPGRHVFWKRAGSGQKDTKYLGHRFIKRKTKLPDRILDTTFALDQIVNMRPKYDAIAEAFSAQKPNDDDEAPFDEDEEDDFDEENWGKAKKKKKGDKKSKRKKENKKYKSKRSSEKSDKKKKKSKKKKSKG